MLILPLIDEAAHETRPHHGLALYVKEHSTIQEVVKHHSQFCEYISAKLQSKIKGQLQVVMFYKYPKCSKADLKKDIINVLKPLVGYDGKLANCDTFCDVIEAYRTDHKLI